jgi:Tfp pilus assembly protein PilV
MRTFNATLRFLRRVGGGIARPYDPRRCADGLRAVLARRPLTARFAVDARSASGVTLIEVIISALLVALIAVGTLTGFDSAGRATADERSHNEATLLAGQDQERLRGLSVAELTQIGTEPRPSVTEAGTTYKIKSSAEFVSASKETLTCKSGEATASYIKTTSTVTWSSTRSSQSVNQSSIVSVPSTATLEVKVANQNNEPVEGATVTVKGTSTNLSQTTGALGCVVFGSVPDKKVEVAVSKQEWVDHEGNSPPPAKSATLSATALTTVEFTLAQPGALIAEFESTGSPTGVKSDTAYAAQTNIGSPPAFTLGTPNKFEAATAPLEGLFPFVTAGSPATANPYTVYAGDCEANNPEVVTNKVVLDKTAQIEPGQTKRVKVEVPAINLTVMSGTGSSSQGTAVTSVSAKLINKECVGKTTQNASPVTAEHTISVLAGKLEPKYAPYAKTNGLELCVELLESSKYYRNKLVLSNTAKAGTTAATFYVKGSGVFSSTTLAGASC